MSPDQRVVLRSSWPAAISVIAPILVVFLAVQIVDRSVGGAVAVLIAVGAVVAGARQLQYVELTPQGLEIHVFGMRPLPARARGSFGVGKKETAEARDLIEAWWQAYSNRPLPIVARQTSPPAAPGGPDDPWRSPPEE
jgi:hypothetical protein